MLVVSGSIWGGGCLPLFPPQQVRTSPGNCWISALGSGCLEIEGVCLREVVSIARGCWDQSFLLVHKDSVTAVCPPWAHCLPSSYFLCKWRSRGHWWPQQRFWSPLQKNLPAWQEYSHCWTLGSLRTEEEGCPPSMLSFHTIILGILSATARLKTFPISSSPTSKQPERIVKSKGHTPSQGCSVERPAFAQSGALQHFMLFRGLAVGRVKWC